MRDGGDILRGEEIEFDLALERVAVSGGASVVNEPEARAPDEAVSPAAEGVAP